MNESVCERARAGEEIKGLMKDRTDLRHPFFKQKLKLRKVNTNGQRNQGATM